jgi:hypothetical protein
VDAPRLKARRAVQTSLRHTASRDAVMTQPSAIRHRIAKAAKTNSSLNLWEKLTRLAALLASFITLLSLWLIWMSYGYDLAYLEQFGLSPDQLGRSATDYLIRSYRPFLALLERMDKLFSWEGQAAIAEKLWWDSAGFALAVSLVLPFIAWCCSLTKGHKGYLEKKITIWTHAIWHSNVTLAVRDLCSPVAVPVRIIRTAWLNQSTRWLVKVRLLGYLGGFLSGLGMFAAMYVLLNVMLSAIGFVVILLTLFPLSAATTGERYAKNEIINPKSCAPLHSHKKPTCVRVIIKGCEVARGREIDRTDKRLFLYIRSTQKPITMELPLNDAIVETVFDEKSPAPSASCIAAYANS